MLRKRVRLPIWIACTVAWIGIVAAFAGEMNHPASSGQTLFGGSLIFASALTYATFIMISGDTIHRVGAMRFTGIAVGFSCFFMLLHYAIAHPLTDLARLSPTIYGYGIILAIFGTVLPSLLMSEGLKRAGAQKFAVISAIGPVATLFLAWVMLSEKPNLFQFGGFILTVGGGLAISLLKDKPAPTARRVALNSK